MPGPRAPERSGVDPSVAVRKTEQAHKVVEPRQKEPARPLNPARSPKDERFFSSFQAATPPAKGPELDPSASAASTLLTENTRDGKANCLDKAADWVKLASPEIRGRSELVFLKDNRAGAEGQSGHVVVRQGSKVYDPTTQKFHDSTDAFLKEQPHYEQVGTLPAGQAKKIFDTPPGSPEREKALERAKVSPELQSMMVADSPASNGPSGGLKQDEPAAQAKADADKAIKDSAQAAKLAEAARGSPGEAAAQQRARDATHKALEALKAANTAAAAACRPPPFPAAENLKDLTDAARLPVEEQKTLLGAKVHISPKEVARADAEQLRQDLKETCVYGACSKALLDKLGGNKNPEYRQALIKEIGPELKTLARQALNTGPEDAKHELRALALAAKLGGPALTQTLATEMADSFQKNGISKEEGDALTELVQSPGGAELGATLANQLRLQGKSGPATGVGVALVEGMRTTRENFQEKKEKLDEANADLAKFARKLSPALTEEQQRKAILDYQERNPAYAEYEEAARKLEGCLAQSATVLPPRIEAGGAQRPGWLGELAREREAVMKHFSDFVSTEAGQKLLQDEIDKQAKGQPSLLDELKDPAKLGKAGTDISTKLTAATTKAMGYMALSRADDPEAMQRLLGTLEKNHALFGCTAGEMKDMAAAFKNLGKGGKEAQEAARNTFRIRSGQLAGGAPGAVQSVRALGFAFSLVGLVDGVSKFSEAEFDKQVKTIGEGLGVTGDGGTMLLQMMGKAGSAASEVFGRVAGVGNVVGVVADGLGAWADFSEGKIWEGAAGSASAVGGLILAAASMQVVPIWGQIAGGILFAAGTATSTYLDLKEAAAKEAEVKKSFLAAGVTEPALSNLLHAEEDNLNVLTQKLKLTPQDVQRIAKEAPGMLTQATTEDLEQFGRMGEAYGLKGSELLGLLDTFRGGKKGPDENSQSLPHLVGLPGVLRTNERAEWDKYINEMIRHSPYPSQFEALNRYLSERTQQKQAA